MTGGIREKWLGVALTIVLIYPIVSSAKENMNNDGDLNSVSVTKNIHQYQHLWRNDSGKGK